MGKHVEEKSGNNKVKIIVIVVIILIIAIAGIVGYVVSLDLMSITDKEDLAENTEFNQVNEEKAKEQKPVEEPKKNIKIFNGDERPIAFMIDNNKNAQPQAALNRTYLVYEIIVEGGETRLMALFKGVDVSKKDVVVGPIRSARHYFIDYALENNAIYAHLGQSPKASDYITTFDVPDINGQVYDTGKAKTSTALFWRDKVNKKAPHNAYTSIASIKEICEKKKYSLKSNTESVLNYVEKENTLDIENSILANKVVIPYASGHTVRYEYNTETGRYTRYSKGTKQKDEETGEDVTTKNLIISFIKNTTLKDGENKDRQDLENFVDAKGYYITNGKAIEIVCKKGFIGGQTKYVDLNGKEIEVNDGNTWINICPIDSNVTIE